MSENRKQIVKMSKALADENRFRIFEMISSSRELACTEITRRMSLSQPTISHHLKVLLESGLIDVRKEGQWNYFFVRKEAVRMYMAAIMPHGK